MSREHHFEEGVFSDDSPTIPRPSVPPSVCEKSPSRHLEISETTSVSAPIVPNVPHPPRRRHKSPPPDHSTNEVPESDNSISDPLFPFVTARVDAVEPTHSISPPRRAPEDKKRSSRRIKPLTSVVAHRQRPALDPTLVSIAALKARACQLKPLENLPLSTYDELLRELEADKQKLFSPPNLRELGRLALVISHVEAYRMAARKDNVFRKMENEHEQDVGLANQDLRAFDNETRQILTKLRKQQSERRQTLLAAHQSELATNIAKWSSEPKLKRYTHPSPGLIMKRKQFELLMKEKNFVQADLCAKDIQATEEREAGEAVIHIQTEFRESKRMIESRQKDEVATQEREFQAEREMVVRRREKERGVLVNVMKKLEAKGDQFSSPEKAWQITRKQKLVNIARSVTPEVMRVGMQQPPLIHLPPL
jgi:hypothetical protein